MLSLLVGCHSQALTEWEHGWKTKRVIATRYSNDVIGYNIGFKFPLDQNNCDRAEISDFIESKGGWIFQGGGYSGAESFAKFNGVNDRASADARLKEILPELDKLMGDMNAGRKISPFKPKEPPITFSQWIEKMSAKKERCDGDGWIGGGADSGGNSYSVRCVNGLKVYTDTSEETQRADAEYQTHKDTLAQALVSRVLTDEEMKEVRQIGSSLLVRNGQPYYPEDIERKFQSMLLIQQIIRASTHHH